MGTERGAAPPAAPPTPPSAHPLPPKSCPHATPVPSAAVAPGCAVPLVPLSPSPHLPRGAGHRVCASLGEVPGCQQRADLCPRVSLPVLTIKGQEHPGVKVPASFRGFGAPREPRYPRGNDTPRPRVAPTARTVDVLGGTGRGQGRCPWMRPQGSWGTSGTWRCSQTPPWGILEQPSPIEQPLLAPPGWVRPHRGLEIAPNAP